MLSLGMYLLPDQDWGSLVEVEAEAALNQLLGTSTFVASRYKGGQLMNLYAQRFAEYVTALNHQS
jgi:hypothetical protein